MPEPPQQQVVGSGIRRPGQQQDEDSTAHEKFVPANPDCLKKTPPRSAQSAQRLTVRLLEASHEPYGLKQWSLSRLRRPRLVDVHPAGLDVQLRPRLDARLVRHVQVERRPDVDLTRLLRLDLQILAFQNDLLRGVDLDVPFLRLDQE